MDNDPEYSISFVVLSNIMCGVAGVVTGHWLQLWRDRRHEYNDLADRLFLRVDGPVTRDVVTHFPLTAAERKLIRRRMGWWKRRRFDRAVDKLRAAMDKNEKDGPMKRYTHLDEVNATRAAIARILSRH
jgi:hypothetical protein